MGFYPTYDKIALGVPFNAKGEVVAASHALTVVDPQNPPTAAQQSEIAKKNQAFNFDGIGNRNSSTTYENGTANVESYTSNALNQYSALGVTARTFDDDGNLTDNGEHLYVWDGENRLIEVKKKSDSSTVATYAYDYKSRRITKTVGSTVTNFVYDEWNPIAEFSGTTVSKSYTWGMDLSGSMQGAGGVSGLLSVTEGNAIYYPVYIGEGDISEYIDTNGSVVAHFEYSVFGETVASGPKADGFSYQFSTKQRDSETGLHYYGYRYYNSVNSRWLGRDPIEEDGGINLYGFIDNDAVNFVDVLGLSKSLCDCLNIEVKEWGGMNANANVKGMGGRNLVGRKTLPKRRIYKIWISKERPGDSAWNIGKAILSGGYSTHDEAVTFGIETTWKEDTCCEELKNKKKDITVNVTKNGERAGNFKMAAGSPYKYKDGYNPIADTEWTNTMPNYHTLPHIGIIGTKYRIQVTDGETSCFDKTYEVINKAEL